MKWFQSLTIQSKLTVSFAAFALAAACIGGIGYLQAADTTAQRVILISVCVEFLLVVAAGCSAARFIARFIRDSTEAMDRLASGDLNARLANSSNESSGTVAASFNRLAGTIQRLTEEARNLVADARLGQAGTKAKVPAFPGAFGLLANEMQALTANTADWLREMHSVLERLALNDTTAPISAEDPGGWGAVQKAIKDVQFRVRRVIEVTAEVSNGDLHALEELKKVGRRCERDELVPAYVRMLDTIRMLIADADQLSQAAIAGHLRARADVEKLPGEFRKVFTGVNATLDSLVGYLDAMPTPAMIIDTERTIRYMNQTGASVGGRTVEEVVGMKCYNHFKTTDCNTERCACVRAMQTNAAASSETIARPGNAELEIAYSAVPVRDRNGTVIGAREVVVDQTAVKRAARKAQKVVAYQQAETQRLIGGLEKLAVGDFTAKVDYAACDDDTRDVHTALEAIKAGINKFEGAVEAVQNDIRILSDAAIRGELNARVDLKKHLGEFRNLVQGLNATLDAVILPVNEGRAALAEMAKGDLTVRMKGEYAGDHKLLKESINAVASSLDTALMQVAEAVSATASASSQISSSTEEMAAGAQQQTSQAGEVASAVEEMSKTILENSQNASGTAQVARQARASAEQGGTIVKDTVAGMRLIASVVNKSAATVKELGVSSDQIGEIITVIDDIADQTNLLALNAAIEAARAGEQGRGFAVVADEVRKLAERTTRATKEIAGMIKKIQHDTREAVQAMEEGTREVDAGIDLADRAGASLEEIVGVSQKMTDMIMQIASASEQQSSASGEISRNVEAISSVSSETASGTQQIARAAEDLNTLTENLQQLVARFKLTEQQKHPEAEESRMAVRTNGKIVRRRSEKQ